MKHLLCWRKELALSFGGMDESLNNVGPDDYDFPWTMAEHGARFQAIPEALYLYRDHRDAERLTTHLPLSVHLKEIRRIMRKHGASRGATRADVVARKGYLPAPMPLRNRADKWLKQLVGRNHSTCGGTRIVRPVTSPPAPPAPPCPGASWSSTPARFSSGLVVNYIRISAGSVGLDEAASIHFANSEWRELRWIVTSGENMSVYYMLLKGWVRVFGESELALRSLSAVAGALAVPAMYLLGAGRSVGWLV